MVKIRHKPYSKATWIQDQLNQAFQMVFKGKLIRKVARPTIVPFYTLQEKLKNNNYEISKLEEHENKMDKTNAI